MQNIDINLGVRMRSHYFRHSLVKKTEHNLAGDLYGVIHFFF